MASPYPGQYAANGPGGGPGGPGGPGGAVPPNFATQPGSREAVPDSYFTESRKGEVNELRNLLRNFATERDPKRKRDIIKKVIAYMTLGIDVSRLFSEMMLAIETRDLVIKKMVYLYLCNYARTHPELAQMCTNTLQKDCGNEDPMVRGLALRALCSLNLPEMVEYISEPLRRSLTDGHAYVRKTGVMGILKLYHLDRDAFDRCNFIDILYDMLKDPDSSVVTNCIIVLNEVMSKSPNGGMAINRAIMLHLLNRIHEFSEFAVIQVLNLVPRYIPANEEEGYQIMNLLDPVIGRSSSGAVLATINAFLSLAEHQTNPTERDAMKQQVVQRIKAPLVTLISASSFELQYTLLKHLEALVDVCPGIFDDEYRQFFVKYNDPTHIKNLKVTILPKLANPDNAPDIVAELAECVHDSNIKMSRLSVRAMARIACIKNGDIGGPGCAESIARRLMDMLDSDIEYIASEAATALSNIIRKHPALKSIVISPTLARSLKYMTESTGKASVIYLLGECGDTIKEAPYSLEKLIDAYDDIKDPNIKIALLSATMKLFFTRPPEVQRMLGKLLLKATDDVSSQDLHDRALFYYRMLKSSGGDVSTIQSIIQTDTVIDKNADFAEEDDQELRQELMKEFDTLSVLFNKPSINFIAEEFQVKYKKMPEEHPLTSDGGVSTNAAAAVVDTAAAALDATTALPTPAAVAPPAPVQADVDFLGFDDPAPAAPAAPAAAPTGGGAFSLSSSITMSGEEYQSKWSAIPDADSIVLTALLRSTPASTAEVETKLASANIMTMASGELPSEFKFFLFALSADGGALFLIQSNVQKDGEPLLILTVKVAAAGTALSLSAQQQQDQANQLLQLINTTLGCV